MRTSFFAGICFSLFMSGCSGTSVTGNQTPASTPAPVVNASKASSAVTPSPAANADASNSSSGAKADFTKMDPYSGSLDAFFPEKFTVGKETWVRTGSAEDDFQIPCPGKGRGAHYGLAPMQDGEYKKRVYMSAGNCSTTAAADEGMQKLAKQNNVTLTPRPKGAGKGGKLINTLTAKSAVWSNGSVIVGLTSNGDADNNDVKRFLNSLPF